MNQIKNYIKYAGVLLIIIFCVSIFFIFTDKAEHETKEPINNIIPAIGQKVWTYDLKTHNWSKYVSTDEDDLNKIIFQLTLSEESPEITHYNVLTTNEQLHNKNFYAGEGSIEFNRDDLLYSYFPKQFLYYEVIYNGVEFVPRKMSETEVSKLFSGYSVIKVSDIAKGNYKAKLSDSPFIILNDYGERFYKYYIIPNDSKKMQIETFSNQFKANKPVSIKLQRLEGCTKSYPCYEFDIIK